MNPFWDGSSPLSREEQKTWREIMGFFEAKDFETCRRLLRGANFVSIVGKDIVDIGPISGALALESLDLSNNQISDLSPLQEVQRLRCLTIGRNRIKSVAPLSKIQALEEILAPSNAVDECAPFGEIPNLSVLEIADNQISSLRSLTRCRSLRRLDVGSNIVTGVDDLLISESLLELDLFGNQIESAAGIQDRLPNLVSLHFGNNHIADCAPFGELKRLEQLNVEGNRIRRLDGLMQMPMLSSLVLRENPIDDFRPLARCARLECVWISRECENRPDVQEVMRLRSDLQVNP